MFEVGKYKWYILVYPQGCDVANHLSLFLCVADYDKLLPGWSHFAQFTIAVVNKDPKKSKYSDTLHRFCKKEHDWGWKKFMELSKVLDGFTVADTLVIRAQVQVIRDRPARPFRCLDPQYRRELVRVYLTNVEGICRRFLDEAREQLSMVRSHADSIRAFWDSLNPQRRETLACEKIDVVFKVCASVLAGAWSHACSCAPSPAPAVDPWPTRRFHRPSRSSPRRAWSRSSSARRRSRPRWSWTRCTRGARPWRTHRPCTWRRRGTPGTGAPSS